MTISVEVTNQILRYQKTTLKTFKQWPLSCVRRSTLSLIFSWEHFFLVIISIFLSRHSQFNLVYSPFSLLYL